ncbi:MAG TPA: protein kinase [Ktedonobacteraceae bacterium]
MVMETLPPGTILHGRYRIERVLGSGGFGHVYLAVDLQANTQYAIKEYLVTGPSGKAQLEHEEQVLSQLHHPNLPAFLAAFDERGRYYVVLGYIEGSDLTDYIRVVRQRNEVVPVAQILTWILSIADAVISLHSQQPQIIHRDIKPDNIRITPEGKAMLVDLGNAKEAVDGARTLFFIRHQGTPGYAPLEQYPGGSGTDARSDVYALGGTLYFALTTHEPPSVSTRNQSIQQHLPDLPSLQEQIARNPPADSADSNAGRQFRLGVSKPAKPAPRHSRHLAQLGTLPPELLDRLNSIIKHAMEMKQKDRYQSVADFSNDLRMVLAALPSSTQPPSTRSPRNVDPHSTQPDLPLLFEELENARGNTEPTSADTAAMPGSQTPSPASTVNRCPYCTSPLPRKAPFCPNCGNSLTNISTPNPVTPLPVTPDSHANNPPAMGRNTLISQDAFGEATIMVTPPISKSPSVAPSPPTQASSARPSPDFTNQKRQSSNSLVQNLALSPPQLPPRPFIQAKSSPAVIATAPQVPPPGSAAPANNSVKHTVSSNGSRKIFIVLAIIIAVILLAIIIAILLVTGKNHSHQTVVPLHAQFYSIKAQVFTHERNVSLGITSSIAPALAGIRSCGSGISSAPRFTERMAGP